MIMIMKTPGPQKGSPAAAEEGAEGREEGRGEGGERKERTWHSQLRKDLAQKLCDLTKVKKKRAK